MSNIVSKIGIFRGKDALRSKKEMSDFITRISDLDLKIAALEKIRSGQEIDLQNLRTEFTLVMADRDAKIEEIAQLRAMLADAASLKPPTDQSPSVVLETAQSEEQPGEQQDKKGRKKSTN